MKIAILGYGTVGSGVAEIIEKRAGENVRSLTLTYILDKKENQHKHPLMCDDIQTILQDSNVDVVVETIGGIEPAHTFIIQALSAGKHVVSANKAVIARYAKEFHTCAKAHGVKLLYEASCGGGIPWLHQLQSVKRIDTIDEIHGIFNGTSNYILDHMTKEERSFDEVLKQAQNMGYAEADPSADIDGYDIQNKLKIAMSVAFDCAMPDDILTFPLRHIRKEDIAYAKSLQKTIKYIAHARRKDNRYTAIIEPVLYDQDAMEASVHDNFNLTCMHGQTIGDYRLFAQGAGKLPTAHAIVQDLLDLAQGTMIPDIAMETVLDHDDTLLQSSYIIRSILPKSQIRAYLKPYLDHVDEGNDCHYYITTRIPKAALHQRMKEILRDDPQAFLMALSQKEEQA